MWISACETKQVHKWAYSAAEFSFAPRLAPWYQADRTVHGLWVSGAGKAHPGAEGGTGKAQLQECGIRNIFDSCPVSIYSAVHCLWHHKLDCINEWTEAALKAHPHRAREGRQTEQERRVQQKELAEMDQRETVLVGSLLLCIITQVRPTTSRLSPFLLSSPASVTCMPLLFIMCGYKMEGYSSDTTDKNTSEWLWFCRAQIKFLSAAMW